MVIQRVGGFCFKLSSGDTTVAVNPPSSRSKHKVSKFGSDIVLVSLSHDDWNGADQASHGTKEPFVISGAGSYEVGEITISGYSTPSAYDDVISDVGNTVYIVDIDGIRVLILGAISNPKLPTEVRGELDNIGIVLVPVGGESLDAKAAHEIVTSIEPKVIIPYAVGTDADMAAFLKAQGASGAKSTDEFTVRPKELAIMDGEVVILE